MPILAYSTYSDDHSTNRVTVRYDDRVEIYSFWFMVAGGEWRCLKEVYLTSKLIKEASKNENLQLLFGTGA